MTHLLSTGVWDQVHVELHHQAASPASHLCGPALGSSPRDEGQVPLRRAPFSGWHAASPAAPPGDRLALPGFPAHRVRWGEPASVANRPRHDLLLSGLDHAGSCQRAGRRGRAEQTSPVLLLLPLLSLTSAGCSLSAEPCWLPREKLSLTLPSVGFSHSPFPSLYPWLLLLLIEYCVHFSFYFAF